MQVGMSLAFQALDVKRSDADVYAEQMHLGSLSEPLGFQSLWVAEHHFTSYMLTPQPTQILSYFAGRLGDAMEFGTMAIILPWHDPVRVVEHVSILDNMTRGRFTLGIGRGLGNIEFEGLRIPMSESRERFAEMTDIVVMALNEGMIRTAGDLYPLPDRELRPRPFSSFAGRVYSAGVSPESLELIARKGFGLLISPQKPWHRIEEDAALYRRVFRETHAREAPPAIVTGYVYCDEDGDRAEEAAMKYVGEYYHSTIAHYNLDGDHFGKTKGYGYYDKFASTLGEHGNNDAARFFADLQIFGTPDQCYERILELRDRVGAGSFLACFSYASMPADEAERNMRLFAERVVPRLRALPAAPGLSMATGAGG